MVCSLVSASSFAAVWTIKYPRSPVITEKHHEYPLAVLTLALESTGVRYQLVQSERVLLQAKAVRQLKKNREINVFWGVTDKQREQELLPIRIPITKGLIGWRIALIREQNQMVFNEVSSLRELLGFVATQGRDWPDTKILQSNGFNVTTSENYLASLEALLNGKADFFPRSVIEVSDEWRNIAQQSKLLIEDSLVFHYPTAIYFFVSKSNLTLANLIETGLQRSIASGEFDTLFTRSFKQPLEDLKLGQRQIFRLSNPLLPKQTPINDSSLWFELD